MHDSLRWMPAASRLYWCLPSLRVLHKVESTAGVLHHKNSVAGAERLEVVNIHRSLTIPSRYLGARIRIFLVVQRRVASSTRLSPETWLMRLDRTLWAQSVSHRPDDTR